MRFPLLVLALTLAGAGLCHAQPDAAPKKETTDEFMARYEKERKARIVSDFAKTLREKFKLSDDDVNAVQLFIARQDAQLRSVQTALYQVTLAANDNANVGEDEYLTYWNDFQLFLTTYREVKAQNTAKLSEQLHLDQNVRLRSFLTMRGIIGDELSLMTPMSKTFLDSDMLSYHLKKELGEDKPKRVVIPDAQLQ